MKRILLSLLLILLGVKAATAASSFSEQQARLLQKGLSVTAEEFILPNYQSYAATTDALVRALTDFCGGKGDMARVKTAYRDSFLDWQRASILQIGPVMEGDGPLRFQLWPDPKGFSRRAVSRALKKRDPALLDVAVLETKSIALINLSALETILYGPLEAGSYACDLGLVISRYQNQLANSLVESWTVDQSFRKDFDDAANGNERFQSVDEVIRPLLAGVIVYADRLRKFKIHRGLGQKAGRTYPERTEAHRSGLGLASIEAGFRAMADLYDVPGGFFDVTPDVSGPMDYLTLVETSTNIADTIMLETRSLKAIAEEDGPMAQRLREFGEMTLQHEDYLKIDLPQATGLISGFTSADGD